MFTLTYEKEPLSEWGIPTLVKKDLQLFFKRLRTTVNRAVMADKKQVKEYLQELDNPQKFKYYAAGEYGSKYGRPHYHVIIIGGLPNLPKQIVKAWEHGTCHQAPLNQKTIRYTLKYLTKRNEDAHSEGMRESEFQLMSQGIGKNYLTRDMVKYMKANLNAYVTTKDGIKMSLPRYYKEKALTPEERLLMDVKTQVYTESKQITFKNPEQWQQEMKKEQDQKRDVIRRHAKGTK